MGRTAKIMSSAPPRAPQPIMVPMAMKYIDMKPTPIMVKTMATLFCSNMGWRRLLSFMLRLSMRKSCNLFIVGQ